MKKKSILFITHLYYPSVGGAERVFLRLAEGLAAHGWDVTVLTSDALTTEHYFTDIETGLPSSEIVNGVSILRESIHAPAYTRLRMLEKLARKLGRLGVFFRPLVFGPHLSRAFNKVRDREYDTVIAGPVPTTATFYGLAYKRRHPAAQLILFPHMHIRDIFHTSVLNRWALRQADLVFALTEAEQRALVERRIASGKIKRIVNGIDDHILSAAPSQGGNLKDFVLYLGHEGAHKRIPLLIQAMRRIWETRGIETPLVIAGARTQASLDIDRLIEALPKAFASRVHRFNDIGEEEKIRLIDNCAVLVNPSSFEAFGLVFLEAWARKKPVIGARIEALQEIILDGQNGFLFDSNRKGDLEEKITMILGNKTLARRFGEVGFARVEKEFRWEKIISRMEQWLAEGRTPPGF
ncbi:MAG: glycosyltransferase family 4 protein [Candidatus Aminicenantales bacterium]